MRALCTPYHTQGSAMACNCSCSLQTTHTHHLHQPRSHLNAARSLMTSLMTAAMPGSFLSTCNEPQLFHRPSTRSALFMPPSPSPRNRSTSSSQSSARPSATSTTTTTTTTTPSLRKRARLDTSCQATRISHGPHPLGDYDDEPPSPVPLVNTDYRIAGGLDTPRAEGAGRDEPNWELENDLRVNRFTHPPSPPSDSVFPRTPQHPGDTGDGDGSGRPAQASTSGWGHTLWSLTGSVAGKLINLCWTTAFSGFHAGGGRGYHMQLDTPTVTAAEPSWPDLADDVFDSNFSRRGRGSTPIPGEFPEDDSVQDHSSRLRQRQAADTPLQMATNDPGASSLRRNWVMIASPSGRRSESASPVRKKHRPSTSISLPGRATARPSYGGRPRKPTAGGGGTSYASPRSSLRSGSSSLLSPPPPSSSCRPVASDHGGRYKLSHTAAAASPRQTYSNPRASEPSSKSPDVLRFERKLRHENLRQSDSIKRMNERMRQLLQEGQQALASKIEVSDPIDDDDDDYDDHGDASGHNNLYETRYSQRQDRAW